MLAIGRDINEQDHNGNTLAHKAILTNNITLLQDIVELGADIRLKNKNGESPVFFIKFHPCKTADIMNNKILLFLLDKFGPCILTDFDNFGYNCISAALRSGSS